MFGTQKHPLHGRRMKEPWRIINITYTEEEKMERRRVKMNNKEKQL